MRNWVLLSKDAFAIPPPAAVVAGGGCRDVVASLPAAIGAGGGCAGAPSKPAQLTLLPPSGRHGIVHSALCPPSCHSHDL